MPSGMTILTSSRAAYALSMSDEGGSSGLGGSYSIAVIFAYSSAIDTRDWSPYPDGSAVFTEVASSSAGVSWDFSSSFWWA